MQPRTTSNPLRHSGEIRGTAVTALVRRISELEQLANAQSRELRIHFERIAQMQAEWDILRIRFTKSPVHHGTSARADGAERRRDTRCELDGALDGTTEAAGVRCSTRPARSSRA